MTQPFCCDLYSGSSAERRFFNKLFKELYWKPLPSHLKYRGIDYQGKLNCCSKLEYAKIWFSDNILPLSEGILILKKMVWEEEKATEKTLTISDVMALLPSSEIIEANGIEGGLRDSELQMFWEGAEWLKKYIENKLTPKPTE